MQTKSKHLHLACIIYLTSLLVPVTTYALDCSVTGLQFYTEAKKRGWKFGCINPAFPSLFAVKPTVLPRPSGDFVCVAKLNQNSELVMVVTGPRTGQSLVSGYLFNDWRLDGFPRHSLVNKKRTPPVTIRQKLTTRSIVFTGKFPAGKTSMIVIKKAVLKAPRNATCKDWKRAVNPRRN